MGIHMFITQQKYQPVGHLLFFKSTLAVHYKMYAINDTASKETICLPYIYGVFS